MPEQLAYLVGWFAELRPQLTYTELHHWQCLTRRSLARWEIEALMRMDKIRCSNTPS